MAEEEDDDLEFEPADAGVGFRAEMAVTNFMLGYWQIMVAVLVVVLLGFLFYGQYDTWNRNDQRSTTRAVFEATAPLRSGGVELDAAGYAAVADELKAIGEGARGMGRVEALMKAAELYRLAEKPDEQRAMLELAAEVAPPVLAFAARSAVANLDLEAGNADAATATLRGLMDTHEGFLAEQAAVDLGLVYEHLGQTDEARALYAEFGTRFPDSAFADQVRDRLSRLGAG